MSASVLINNSINDLKQTLNNNDIMYRIVNDLASKIRTTNIVTPANKDLINQYLNRFPGANTNQIIFAEQDKITEVSGKDLLLLTIIYYVSDLNKYDFHLINFAIEYGLTMEDVIVLLLLNDMYSIDRFCKLKGLLGTEYYTICTLKKLSALHKVEWNF